MLRTLRLTGSFHLHSVAKVWADVLQTLLCLACRQAESILAADATTTASPLSCAMIKVQG